MSAPTCDTCPAERRTEEYMVGDVHVSRCIECGATSVGTAAGHETEKPPANPAAKKPAAKKPADAEPPADEKPSE